MGKKVFLNFDRERTQLAQEAARIIVEQGIQDFRVAKIKAAERLGMSSQGALPNNTEIESAVADHLRLFGRDEYTASLTHLRQAALSAMELLSIYSPRLVGPVLSGTAAEHSAVNLHLFWDQAESVAGFLEDNGVRFKLFERRLKHRRNQVSSHAGYRFEHQATVIEATVFPINGMRQAPISPVDGKPMRRVDAQALTRLLNDKSF